MVQINTLSIPPSHIDMNTPRLVIQIKSDRPFDIRNTDWASEPESIHGDAAESSEFVPGSKGALAYHV
ncbi:hypothetical protein N7447_004448 [Penicillium robsamsonii]|uniref:uncharacterized protein n=1 Tax=Penicillium robsamsonii TaxID=1792511 RepID=UPI00254848B6|nr:uncharacterized protein N7447_004448 [Penicillium robsamsonii]KAJ5827685.1 hypothetical protein N7447_004448 [Penicillium robsamsonii]